MLEIVLIGSGGHANILWELLSFSTDYSLLGVVSPSKPNHLLADACWLYKNDNECIQKLDRKKVSLINGIGSVGRINLRAKIYQKYSQAGFQFSKVIHPSAVIANSCEIAESVQIMAGTILQTGVSIGDNVLLNTGASIDHDCNIGRSSHIAPGVVISGDVSIGDETHIGTGARVIQGVKIGNNCVVGAGVTVLADVPDGKVLHPAQSLVWSGEGV